MKRSLAILLTCLLAASTSLSQENSPSAASLKQAAREAFSSAEPAKARKHLDSLLSRYRAEYTANPSWRGEYQWSRRLTEVAHEYLRAGQLDDALAVLGEAADLHVPLRTGFENGLASAAGGLHRRLAALDSDERYDLLYEWSMPTESRRTVRVLEALVPDSLPPAAFARALGERARDTSFPIAQVGEVSGLFSTAWELVQAADDTGRLRRLTAELEKLATQDVANAENVLLLARIAAGKFRDETLVADLDERLRQLRDGQPAANNRTATGFDGAWQYGYGAFDVFEQETSEFTPLPVWSGAAWQTMPDRPDPTLGFIRLDRSGGHPGPTIACIRRWTAPAAGTVSVSGTLHQPIAIGDGVRARVIASRGGVRARVVASRGGAVGPWKAFNSMAETDAGPIAVKAGDTLDFVVDMIENTTYDAFIWLIRLRLTMGEKELVFDSFDDFCGPHETNMLDHAVVAAACMEHDELRPISQNIFAALIENTSDADAWMNRPTDVDSPLLRPALRRAWALAVRRPQGALESSWLDRPGLQHWIATGGRTTVQHARGHARQSWLAHEDHFLHLAGTGNDGLLLKYPLTGAFQFSVETQAGGRPGTDGGIAFGGLGYLLEGCDRSLRVTDEATGLEIVRPSPNVRVQLRLGNPYVVQPLFNRATLTMSPGRTMMGLNGQAIWIDSSSGDTAPWLALKAQGDRMPVFRNLRITGNPVIPREVRMSDGDSLRGWSASYYGDRLPAAGLPEASGQEHAEVRVSNANHTVPYILAQHILATSLPDNSRVGGAAIDIDGKPSEHDWFAADGVIHGLRRQAADVAIAQSRLNYIRPLLDGESISYEFLYEPDKYEVHPALGRLAFLVEPDGVRLHWMTDGDREWTGLAEDNTVVEPFDRRGPKPLPLVDGDWNRLTIALADETATLLLNDQLIYQRKLDAHEDRTFGFYHDACRTAVQVKNVVMRGDWPERLSAEHRDDLAAVSVERSTADRLALNELFQEQHLTERVLHVARHAAGLPDKERYSYLADWVLPSDDHVSLRMVGRFAPLPAPPSSDQPPLGLGSPLALPATDSIRLQTDAQLVAPALQLIDVAKRLGRLDDLRRRLTVDGDLPSTQTASQRPAMLALVALASSDFATVNTHLAELVALNNLSDEAQHIDRWPETLALWMAMRHAETEEAARELIELLNERVRYGKVGESDAWKHHLAQLSAAGRFQDEAKAINETVIVEPLQQWDAVSHISARSRGQGFPAARWARLPHRVDNVVAHDRDYLYFQSPLRGNFQVECEVVSSFYRRESSLTYAGWWTQLTGSLADYGVGGFRDQRPEGETTGFDSRLTDPGPWMRYRLAVQDGRMKVYCNGRLIHERAVDADCDPWLAVRSHWQRNGGVRDVRISGDPIIPEQINLAVDEALSGWLSYFDEPMGIDSRGWHYIDGELNSPSTLSLTGWSRGTSGEGGLPKGTTSKRVSEEPSAVLANASGYDSRGSQTNSDQRLLHYHRPMLEDGTIEYEFYYEPERSHVHPALDRLALLLETGGVREHWVTDGEYDETGLDPANTSSQPRHRRGPDRLPLLSDAWNKVQLELSGDTILVKLNGQLVYERPLEPSNLRTFGLFHDANRTSARVRNLVLRGDWPRELPPLPQQELADVSDVTSIDQQLAELPTVLNHGFSAGLSDWFAASATRAADKRRDVKITADGLQIIHAASRGDGETSVGNRFAVAGDFDIRASFDQLTTQTHPTNGTSHAGISAQVIVNNPDQHAAYMVRKQHPGIMRQVEVGYTWGSGENHRHDGAAARIHDGAAGTFRFVRRNETIYSMFADGDSPNFYIIAKHTIPPGEVSVNGIRLATHALGGSATQVVWKNVTIRAERLAKSSTDLLAGKLTPAQDTPPVRYVRIELPNRIQILSLAEVEVFSNDKNVALAKRASQSSVDHNGSANLAVDGDRNGHYFMAGSVTHTRFERNPWWEVDLGRSYAIDRMLIWNRSDWEPNRLAGYRVRLFDVNRKLIWEQAPQLLR